MGKRRRLYLPFGAKTQEVMASRLVDLYGPHRLSPAPDANA